MATYAAVDGTPAVANKWLLREILKKEWNWSGLIVTDWNDVGQLVSGQHVANNYDEAAELAIKGGDDLMMTCKQFYQGALNAINAGKVNISIVDEAVRNHLNMKFALGLFDDPRYPDHALAKSRASSPFSRSQNQKLAEESLVLLKNDGLLPLDKSKLKRIAVVGPNADHVGQQLGDWAGSQPRDLTITIVDGMKEDFSGVTDYEKGCGIESGETGNLTAALEAINAADAAFVVIGDRLPFYGEHKSTATLDLQGGQIEMLNAIVATKKKFTLIVISSKPLVIPQNIRDGASAIIWQFCPGNFGGRAVTRAIFGEVNPSGRLPISIPSFVGQQPCYYYKFRYWHGGYADYSMDPVWSFGYGLGYSTIDYVTAKLDKTTYSVGEDIHVSITVKNSGSMDADEVIQIYIADLVTSVTWVDHQLKGFKRQTIKAGESVTIDIVVSTNDCWLINANEEQAVEAGAFEARVGKASNDIKFKLGFTIQ
jgi:beta-glucosidase